MNIARSLVLVSSATVLAAGCSAKAGSSSAVTPSDSEVAVSVVSGAFNNNSGSSVAWAPRPRKKTAIERALSFMNPIGKAEAATWSCSGETLTPAFRGAAGDPYAFTPPTCRVTWDTGKPATSTWSGPFTLSYGDSCGKVDPFMEDQSAGCVLTRTSSGSGDTRTVTGPDGNDYAITHDTDGAGTGWDSSVTPAPTNAGVIITCGSGGCADSGTLVVSGSNLTGTVTIDGLNAKIWDHTVSTGSGGITVTGSGSSRLVSGTVIVQHNILEYTSTTTFSSVAYGDPDCCFPTGGTVSTTFSKGADTGKTETLSFSSQCGETTYKGVDGITASVTLTQCL